MKHLSHNCNLHLYLVSVFVNVKPDGSGHRIIPASRFGVCEMFLMRFGLATWTHISVYENSAKTDHAALSRTHGTESRTNDSHLTPSHCRTRSPKRCWSNIPILSLCNTRSLCGPVRICVCVCLCQHFCVYAEIYVCEWVCICAYLCLRVSVINILFCVKKSTQSVDFILTEMEISNSHKPVPTPFFQPHANISSPASYFFSPCFIPKTNTFKTIEMHIEKTEVDDQFHHLSFVFFPLQFKRTVETQICSVSTWALSLFMKIVPIYFCFEMAQM